MLPRTQRLSPRARFTNAMALKGDFLSLKINKTGDSVCKIGFVISKKIDKRAVGRNRLKRVLSDTFFRSSLRKKGGYDILCIVFRSVPEDQDDILRDELLRLLLKINT